MTGPANHCWSRMETALALCLPWLLSCAAIPPGMYMEAGPHGAAGVGGGGAAAYSPLAMGTDGDGAAVVTDGGAAAFDLWLDWASARNDYRVRLTSVTVLGYYTDPVALITVPAITLDAKFPLGAGKIAIVTGTTMAFVVSPAEDDAYVIPVVSPYVGGLFALGPADGVHAVFGVRLAPMLMPTKTFVAGLTAALDLSVPIPLGESVSLLPGIILYGHANSGGVAACALAGGVGIQFE